MKSAKRGFLFFLGFIAIDFIIVRVIDSIFGFATWFEFILFLVILVIIMYLAGKWVKNQLKKNLEMTREELEKKFKL
jgi:membrane protein implicated in regulation of membrane protease activity